MMQSLHIKLYAGADFLHRCFTLSLCVLGFLALLLNYSGLAWPLLMLGSYLLLRWVFLETKLQSADQDTLHLYRSGAAKWGSHIGAWGSQISINRFYSTIRVDFQTPLLLVGGNQTAVRSKTFLISASHNDKDDYRCLLIWCRYLPFSIIQKTNGFTSA